MRALLVPLFLGWARAAPNASAWCRAACGFDWRSTVPLESDDVLSGCAYRDLAHYVIDHDGVVDYRAVDTTAAGAAPLAYRPREMGPLRFGGASLAGPAVAARCLPPVPIVFLALKSSTDLSNFDDYGNEAEGDASEWERYLKIYPEAFQAW